MTHLMAHIGAPGRRDAASAMGVHRASGATHPAHRGGPPEAGWFFVAGGVAGRL